MRSGEQPRFRIAAEGITQTFPSLADNGKVWYAGPEWQNEGETSDGREHLLRGTQIRALRRHQRGQVPASMDVFTTEPRGPMSPATFRKLVTTIGQVAELPFPAHPHMLRHAAGDLHRAARLTWFIGHIGAEIAMARRHGRDARSGRNSKAALPRAHESQREAIQERLAPRKAEILRLDGLRPNLKDKSERARHIKAGWKKVLGLDKWVDAHNSVLEDKKDRVRTLSEDRISRMLPTRK